MRVARFGPGQDFAVEIVQRRKQRDGAMPFVVVRAGADVSDSQGQARLRSFQRLTLALFVAASTRALSGGFKYNPMTSQNFRSNCGSLEILKVRRRCGFRSLFFQMRWTLWCDTPNAAAMPRNTHDRRGAPIPIPSSSSDNRRHQSQSPSIPGYTKIPGMPISCLQARIGNRITDREMVHHLPLLGRQVEITVHRLIVERADTGRP
jgi:hypothetical protein